MKAHINDDEREEISRQDRFAVLREEKIGRLKDLYSSKNKNQKGRNTLSPNAKINSFGELPRAKLSSISKDNLKQKLIFNRQEDFHYFPQPKVENS